MDKNHDEAFGLNEAQAKEIINNQIAIIHDNWLDVADMACLSKEDVQRLGATSFFNPYIFHGYCQEYNLPKRKDISYSLKPNEP